MLDVRQLSKRFVISRSLFGRPKSTVHAVDSVSFRIAEGETVGLVGESGSGKTTVGRLVLRLLRADSGDIRLDGVAVPSLKGAALLGFRSKARMIFQDPYSSLNPRMVIGRAIAEPLVVHTELSRPERDAAVRELMEQVGLGTDLADRFPYELSGGQLQRAAVARAIATAPDLIVCDEPVAALDMSLRAQIINLLADLQQTRNLAYLFISHDLSLVRLIADRVLVMYRGRIVEEAPSDVLFREPMHPYTRRLLAAIPMVEPWRRATRPKRDLRREAPIGGHRSGVGCSYAEECPLAEAVCRETEPSLTDIGGHSVACHVVTRLD